MTPCLSAGAGVSQAPLIPTLESPFTIQVSLGAFRTERAASDYLLTWANWMHRCSHPQVTDNLHDLHWSELNLSLRFVSSRTLCVLTTDISEN